MDVHCPHCDKEFDVRNHADWSEFGWEMKCPYCGKDVLIDVGTKYNYNADVVPD